MASDELSPRLQCPSVLECLELDGQVRWRLAITADLNCFHGHFDQLAIVPGVVQLTWAANFCRDRFGQSAPLLRVDRLKFTRPMLPGIVAELTLRPGNDGRVVSFDFRDAQHRYSAGQLIYG